MTVQNYTIRELKTPEEHRACEKLQASIWRGALAELTPADLMISVQKHGGIVLGAFDAHETLVGFLFSLPGKPDLKNPLSVDFDSIIFCHLIAVHTKFRKRGIAYSLKLYEKQYAKEQGYQAITWNFDPLEAPNASLYIGKLGCRSQYYIENLYGTMQDKHNRGLASDRLEVVWPIQSELPRNAIYEADELGEAFLEISSAKALNLDTEEVSHKMGDKLIVLEIPSYLQNLKLGNRLEHRQKWRIKIRETFRDAFNSGYFVDGITKNAERMFYVLRRSGY